MAHSSLRFGIGRFTTEAEIDFVVQHIIKTVHTLREMRCDLLNFGVWRANFVYLSSPLWEMVQEGIDINSIDWSQH
jgi:cysteine desulfurase